MQWFKHDTDAHRDAKLRRVKMKYGMEGYGLYWYCLELVAGDISRNNLTFELEHDAEIIADDTNINYQLVQEMMSYMVDLGLFENSNGVITCMKLAKRLDQSMTSNPEFRKSIAKMLENHDTVMTEPEIVMQELEQNRTEQNRIHIVDSKLSPCPHEKIISLYHEKLPALPQVRSWTPKRKTWLTARWREDKERQSLEWWGGFFEYIGESQFLTGNVPGRDGKPPFMANLEWILNQTNFTNINEGKYHR